MSKSDTKTMSVTMWRAQSQLIDDAAKDLGVSASEFIRMHTLPAAAKQLKIPMPSFPEFEKPGFVRGAVAIAAESLGMTKEQFKQQMAERAAAMILGERQAPAAVDPAAAPVRRRRGG